jgi:hypothetical protein
MPAHVVGGGKQMKHVLARSSDYFCGFFAAERPAFNHSDSISIV